MALRSPELRFAVAAGLGALSRPSRIAPPPSTRSRPPRCRRSPFSSPSPSDSNPSTAFVSTDGAEGQQGPEWKKVSAKQFGIKESMIPDEGIKESMIPDEAWNVLRRLRSRGYDVYLVGGFVRDLIMKKTPKDFDIITAANLRPIARA